jgi:uncharacterized protein (TIGR04552 family)
MLDNDKPKHPASKGTQASVSTQSWLMNDIGLSDLEAVRLILSGNSVIDWNRANFRTLSEVDRFLAVQHLDWSDPIDRTRIEHLYQSSVAFLEQHLGLMCTPDFQSLDDIRTIFVWASDLDVDSERQTIACTILKLMHVLQHMDSAELRHRIPLAEATLLEATEHQILSLKDQMVVDNPGVIEFYGSRKTRESTIAKLLAKKEDVASTVFDKLRFRIITQSVDDILPLMVWLQRYAFPYNFVIPGQSHNNLQPFLKMLSHCTWSSPPTNGIPHIEQADSLNAFSSASFKVINFIVDVPVRVDPIVDYPLQADLGRVVFVMVEFQIVDQVTAQRNEEGANAHSLYKERQLERVRERLKYGKTRTD